MDATAREMRNRFVLSLVFTLAILAWSSVGESVLGHELATPFGIDRKVWQLILSLPVLWAARGFFAGAVWALRQRTLDMNVLVAVAIGVSWVYSAAVTAGLSGDVFFDAGAMLATFVLLGHWFEMRARGGASDAIRTLLDLAPPKAVVLRDGEPIEVPTAEVAVDDLLLIRPGAKVPVDAEVLAGESEVDESTVTGESLPAHKGPGDRLVGATINKNGTLRARATAVGADTALAQIVNLVQQAQNSKAPAQRLADRAASWLVVVALGGGLLTFLIWALVVGRDGKQSLLYGITVVVITCPDALGLATPTAIMVGSSLGGKRGILFKNATALEQVASVDTVVFDKTGTLTRGQPEVVEIATAAGIEEDELLRLVAAAERDSEHPLARAIVDAASKRGLKLSTPDAFAAVPGHGVLATIDGHRLAIGNQRLTDRGGAALNGLGARAAELAGEGRTVVQVAFDDQPAGVIAIADAPRETSRDAVAALRQLGVRAVMLTGDSHATGERVAAEIGIEE
jgi:Cu2+-exporting ATPase